MKLSEWAKKQGVSYRTALRWFHGGTLPVEAEQIYTGTIIVKVETVLEHNKTALYARVSSSDQNRTSILRLFVSLNSPLKRNCQSKK
jgi:putative resolvase